MAIAVLLVVAIDQYTKYMVRTTPALQNWDIIKGWLAFHYTQNPGMALGINIIPTPVISVISSIAIIVIIIFTVRIAARANIGQMICMGMIIGGATGNIIDRMFMGIIQSYGGFMQGHVVDFIFFTKQIDGHTIFPYIFNVADAFITTSILILIIFNKYLLPSNTSQEQSESEEKSSVEDTKDINFMESGSQSVKSVPDTE
jgi:signal peptidase II